MKFVLNQKNPAWRTKPCVVARISRLASESRSILDLPCRTSRSSPWGLHVHICRVLGLGIILAHHHLPMTLTPPISVRLSTPVHGMGVQMQLWRSSR